MTTKYLIITLSFLLLTFDGCSRYGGSDNPASPSEVTPRVYLEPAILTKTAWQEFTINVYIENAADLFYASVYLEYDPSKLSYITSIEGDFLKQGGASVSFNGSGQNGVVIMGITRLGSSSGGASGSGVLCSATFSGAVAGTSTIAVDEDSSGFMDADTNNVTITVGNGTTVNIL